MRPNARRPLTAFLFLFYCETMFLHYAFSKDIVFVFGSVYVSPTLLYEHKKRKKKNDWTGYVCRYQGIHQFSFLVISYL